jgi:hypothetical protein
LQQFDELVDRETGRADDGSESAFGDFPMVRNGNAAMGRLHVPQSNMAAALMVFRVADLSQRPDHLPT